jgi:hypothetical protein
LLRRSIGHRGVTDQNQNFQLPTGAPVDIGVSLNSAAGQPCAALFLNPDAPTGPLDSNYHRPYGGFDYAFAKSWTGKATAITRTRVWSRRI